MNGKVGIAAVALIGCGLFAGVLLSGCSTLSSQERAAVSTGACVRGVVRDVMRRLPPGLTDKQTHCVAAGSIAFHCSVGEARLAGYAKEIKDLFGHGHAQWADIHANRKGIGCARAAAGDAQLLECCR